MQQSHTKLTLVGGNNASRIGANAHLIEHFNEKKEKTSILIDLGALFPGNDLQNAVLIPDVVKYLGYNPTKSQLNQQIKAYHSSKGGKKVPQLDALLLTHMHEDHIGGVVNLLKLGFTFPTIYASRETLAVLGRILIEEGVSELPEMKPVSKEFQLSKDVCITSFPVSHTTVGSLGYHILTKVNGQNHNGIMHLGDFNLSDVLIEPGFDKESFCGLLNRLYITHVLTDSTSVSNKANQELSFKQATSNWAQIMQENKKRLISAVISRSTQNMAPILYAAEQTGRKVFIDGYMQRLVYDELQKAGVLDHFEGTVYNHKNIQEANLSDFIKAFSPQKQVIIFSGAFAEGLNNQNDMMSGLVRVAKKCHKSFLLDGVSLVALSQRAIPVDDIYQNMKEMAELLAEQNNGQIIQNKSGESSSLGDYKMAELQRTGHATFKEMVNILRLIKNNRENMEDNLTVIPVHGDPAQLKQTTKCAQIVKANDILALNGNEIHLTPDGFDRIEKSKTPTSWICFKNDNLTKTASFSADLVEETVGQNQAVQYKKVASFGGNTANITPSKNKNLLLACMRINLDRKLER